MGQRHGQTGILRQIGGSGAKGGQAIQHRWRQINRRTHREPHHRVGMRPGPDTDTRPMRPQRDIIACSGRINPGQGQRVPIEQGIKDMIGVRRDALFQTNITEVPDCGQPTPCRHGMAQMVRRSGVEFIVEDPGKDRAMKTARGP